MRDRLNRAPLRPGAVLGRLGVGFGQGRAVDHVQRGVEQQQEAGPAGVDDAGVLEHGQQVGRAVERGLPAPRAASSTSTSARPSADAAFAASADSRTTVRIVPSIGFSTAW